MGKHVEMKPVKQRVCAIIASGVLAASSVGAPLAAFAIEPTAGGQTGSGATDVTVQLIDAGTERGGTEDDGNKSTDGDEYGDNIAFSVPTSINFVAKANGELEGPSTTSTYIENHSAFDIHASSMRVEKSGEWNIVADAAASSAANSVSFSFGPTGDVLNASEYLTKKGVGDASKWHMRAPKSAESDGTQRVNLSTAGKIANVNQGMVEKSKVAVIHTYVTPGSPS